MAEQQLIATTVYLPPELHEALRELAFRRRTTMSELIRQAVLAWLERERNQDQARQ